VDYRRIKRSAGRKKLNEGTHYGKITIRGTVGIEKCPENVHG